MKFFIKYIKFNKDKYKNKYYKIKFSTKVSKFLIVLELIKIYLSNNFI